MNKIIKFFALLFAWTALLSSCSPEEYSLGNVDVKPEELVEGIAFKIEHDANNPNIVYLTSLMDAKYTPLWDHPQGRSQEKKVTLKIPFAGVYTVKFGVETRGGVVYGAPATFSVDQMYAEFISNEMWTKLTGGAGQEKTWYLDLDENGLSRYFLGPMYFYGTGDWWGTVNGTGPALSSDSWNWQPDWKSNSWIMPKGDYGSMTFNLKGGANVIVNHSMLNKSQTGTFNIDVDNKTMRMNDAQPLHGAPQDGVVVDWGNIRIMSLTDNTMQLAVLRDEVLSGEGPALFVFNYISKDFKDNWVPGNQPDPEPPYEGNANDDLTTTTSTKKTWSLSLNTPYNWANLKGELLNAWTKPADYPGWAPYDATMISKVALELDKTGDNAGSYKFTDGNGNNISGTYTTDDKNNVIFDKEISFAISGGISLATTAEKKLRIISTEKDATGNITGIWLGKKDPSKDEYLVFKFEPKAGANGPVDPMAAWKTALVGKTFKPDVNYFADWVVTDWTGGWTTGIFGDYTSNTWLWTEAFRDAAAASSIKFYMDGNVMKADAVDNGTARNGIVVDVDPTAKTLTFSENPFTFHWVYSNNNSGKGPWILGARDGANLGNVNTKGIYLAYIADPGKPNEYGMVHWVIK
ncbi:hypothetical protein [Pelobium manganitolerans]|uniref:hypothetical protein n=1 Tax=Pelobium manganitolerans TaxID=1842495 RepID=UPI003FA34C90